MIPKANVRDLSEIPKELKRDLTFVLAARVDDVLKAALGPREASKPEAAKARPPAAARTPARRKKIDEAGLPRRTRSSSASPPPSRRAGAT